MLIPDKQCECKECRDNCESLSGIGKVLWCHAQHCNVYFVPPYEEDYINKYKEEVKQQPLTDWEKIDLKKQLEEQGKKIKNLTAEVEELRFTVKQILKIKEKQNYPKGEY